jgi:hypothetical protein
MIPLSSSSPSMSLVNDANLLAPAIVADVETTNVDELLFRKFAKKYSGKEAFNRQYYFPLHTLLLEEVSLITKHIGEKGNILMGSMGENEKHYVQKLRNICLLKDEFVKNLEGLVTFFEKISKENCVNNKVDAWDYSFGNLSHFLLKSQQDVAYFNDIVELFKTKNLALLNAPTSNYCPEGFKEPSDFHQVAFEVSKYALFSLIDILAFSDENFELDDDSQFDKMFRLTGSNLQTEATLNVSQKVQLLNVFKASGVEIQEDLDELYHGLKNQVEGDLLNNYGMTFHSPEGTCKKHVQENFEVYENFYPRLLEVKNWFADMCNRLEKKATLVRCLPLFLRFGDLISFRSGLEKINSLKRKTFIQQEVLNFAVSLKAPEMIRKTLPFLMEENGYRAFSKRINEMHHTTTHWKKKIAEFEKGPLALLEKFLQTRLTQLAPIAQPAQLGQLKKLPARKAKPIVLSPHKNVTVVLPVIQVSKPAEVPALSVPKIELEVRIRNLKDYMKSSLNSLKDGCKGFGVREALSNVQIHWGGLLCTMNRLTTLKSGRISERELMASIIDIVRESSIVMEQFLSAHYCASNRIQNQEALKGQLTHNLYQILLKCQFKGRPLFAKDRKTIIEMNYAEIRARDLSQCRMDGTDVEKLLAKTWLMVEGGDPSLSENLIEEAFSYFERVGLFCIEMQRQMSKYSSRKETKKIENFENEFTEFCNETENIAFEVIPNPVNPPNQVSGIVNTLLEFRKLLN